MVCMCVPYTLVRSELYLVCMCSHVLRVRCLAPVIRRPPSTYLPCVIVHEPYASDVSSLCTRLHPHPISLLGCDAMRRRRRLVPRPTAIRRRTARAERSHCDRTVGSFHYHLRRAGAPVTGGSIMISLRALVVSLPAHPGDVSPLVRPCFSPSCGMFPSLPDRIARVSAAPSELRGRWTIPPVWTGHTAVVPLGFRVLWAPPPAS